MLLTYWAVSPVPKSECLWKGTEDLYFKYPHALVLIDIVEHTWPWRHTQMFPFHQSTLRTLVIFPEMVSWPLSPRTSPVSLPPCWFIAHYPVFPYSIYYCLSLRHFTPCSWTVSLSRAKGTDDRVDTLFLLHFSCLPLCHCQIEPGSSCLAMFPGEKGRKLVI